MEAGEAEDLCGACWVRTEAMDAQERAAYGEDLPPGFCDPCTRNHALWPENARAWRIFQDCYSQQVRSEGVLLGLDTLALLARLDREGGTERDWRKVKTAEVELVKFEAEEAEKRRKEEERKRKAEEARREREGGGSRRGRR